MSYTALILIGAIVTWRVTRFIIADDLVKGTRQRVMAWVNKPREARWKDFLADKAFDLLTCPWCVSIYVSAGYLALTRWIVVDSIPVPVWSWLAISALSVIPYQFVDGDWVISDGGKAKGH